MIRRTVKEYVLITFGLFSYAFAWIAIIMPANIVGGGVSGIALLIYHATGGVNGGIPLAYSLFVINSGLLVAATAIIGFKFTVKTIYAVIMMPVAMGFLQGVIPPGLLGLGEDQLLSAILAGVIGGIGISVCFSQGGSTGGTDIIAMIINKYRSISYGKVIMTCDFIIIGLAYFIGDNGVATVVYSFVVVAAMGYTLDAVMAGNKQSSQVFIVSREHEKIAEHIISDTHRGVTMLPAEGWYTKTPMKMLVVVCRRSETNTLLRIIKDIDPDAFLTVGSVMGVYGKGFDPLRMAVRGSAKKKPAEVKSEPTDT